MSGVMTLPERLEGAWVAAFRPVLVTMVEGARGDVVLDLSGVQTIDASGAALLVSATRRVAARGGCLSLVRLDRNVRRVLRAHGLDRHLRMVT